MKNAIDVYDQWTGLIESAIPFWKDWGVLSQYQKDVWENYRNMVFSGFQSWFQLAPSFLTQTINPWSFSLFQFTKEIKGTPAKEYKILTEVAGYGSQLGTIMDFLGVLEKNCHFDIKKLQDPEDVYKTYKLQELVKDVQRVKQS